MSVDTTKSAEASRSDTDTLEIGQLDAAVISDRHVFDVTLAVDQDSDLPACFVGELGDLPGKFGCDNLIRRDASGVELLYAAQLIRF